MFGWRKLGHNGYQQQCFSNTSIPQTHQPRQPTPSLQRLTMSQRHCKEECRYCSMNSTSKPSNTCIKYLVRRRPRRTPRTRRSSHPKPNQQTSFHNNCRASKHALTLKGWLSHVQRQQKIPHIPFYNTTIQHHHSTWSHQLQEWRHLQGWYCPCRLYQWPHLQRYNGPHLLQGWFPPGGHQDWQPICQRKKRHWAEKMRIKHRPEILAAALANDQSPQKQYCKVSECTTAK